MVGRNPKSGFSYSESHMKSEVGESLHQNSWACLCGQPSLGPPRRPELTKAVFFSYFRDHSEQVQLVACTVAACLLWSRQMTHSGPRELCAKNTPKRKAK